MAPFFLHAVQVLLVAQAMQATVLGTVRDGETGAPLAGAVVTLTDLERATTTDADGRYVMRQVPAGPQHLAVRFIGYAPRSLHALVPRDGELEINVSLHPAPVRLPTVDVRAPVVVRGVESGDTTGSLERQTSIAAAANHPLLAEPDVFQALGGGDVVLRPESPSGIHIRGGASDQTAYLLDGIPVFSPFHAAGLSSAWNPDALFRLQVTSSAPSLDAPHTLSGAVEAVTRAPGTRFRTRGSASTTQTRLTVDGPLVAGVGYLMSVRSGLPGIIPPKDEASYMHGETGDWLAKLEAPAFGGQARVLGYDCDNEIDAAAIAEPGGGATAGGPRNLFEWHSQALGAEWWRRFSGTQVRVRGWSSRGDAGSVWTAESGGMNMAADRRDEGLFAAMERRGGGKTTALEIRVEQSTTSYRVEPDSAPPWELRARTPVAAAFAHHSRAIAPGLELSLGASLAATGGEQYLGPRAQLRWNPSDPWTFSASYARTHQFAQSLRNAESVVGNVFPVELYIGAGAPGVPVARNDQGVIAADYRPLPGVRLGLQAYYRDLDGLLLVAPRDGEPFTTGAFAVGSGVSRGLAAEAAVSTARFAMLASYGLQNIRIEYGDSSYVPDHGATHLLEGGVTVFPTATASIRLGATAALGRHTTPIQGGFEWESWNLLDQGSEFVGSPYYGAEPLGGMSLPAYFRVDLGLRKHWHLEVGGHDAVIALFGTFANILDRKNVLTYAKDPSTGEIMKIEMRPRAPLVVGLDWRF